MKKITIRNFLLLSAALLSLIVSPLSFATYPDSFYIAALAGTNLLSGQVHQASEVDLVVGGTAVNNIILTPNPSLYRQGPMGSFIAGYQWGLFDRFLLAVEGRAHLLHPKEAIDVSIREDLQGLNSSSQTMVSQMNNYDLVLRPGIFLSEDNHIFLVFGGAHGEFKLSNISTFLSGVSPAPQFTAHSEQVIRKKKWGSLFGVGMDQNLFKRLSIRLEYDYVDFGRIATFGTIAPLRSSDALDTTGSALITDITTHLKNSRAELGLVFSFG